MAKSLSPWIRGVEPTCKMLRREKGAGMKPLFMLQGCPAPDIGAESRKIQQDSGDLLRNVQLERHGLDSIECVSNVAFSIMAGAGISVSANLPDFRSPGELLKQRGLLKINAVHLEDEWVFQPHEKGAW
eukprot:1347729-Amphidinium_carterae.2